MWENLNIALKSLNGIILLIIYLRSTTGLTDTIINELSGNIIVCSPFYKNEMGNLNNSYLYKNNPLLYRYELLSFITQEY